MIIKVPVFPKWPEPEAALATGAGLTFSAALWAVIFHSIPAENEKYVMLLLGALIGVVKDTFARYFNATKGAQEARRSADLVTQTLAEAAASAADPKK